MPSGWIVVSQEFGVDSLIQLGTHVQAWIKVWQPVDDQETVAFSHSPDRRRHSRPRIFSRGSDRVSAHTGLDHLYDGLVVLGLQQETMAPITRRNEGTSGNRIRAGIRNGKAAGGGTMPGRHRRLIR